MGKKPDTPAFILGNIVRRVYNREEAGMIVGVLYTFDGESFLVSWPDETDPHQHWARELVLDEVLNP